MKIVKQRLQLLFIPTIINLVQFTKYNHNIIEMSLKIFSTSIHVFLPHQLSCPIIHATFRLTYDKYETSERTVQYMLKVIVRDTI